jgi:hypothetical protein
MKSCANNMFKIDVKTRMRSVLALLLISPLFGAGCDGCGGDDDATYFDAATTDTDVDSDTDTDTGTDTDTDTDGDADTDTDTDTSDWECVNDSDCKATGTICSESYCFEHQCEIRILEPYGTECEDEDTPNECTTDWCEKGFCIHKPVSGIQCADDDNPCTKDECLNGVCGFPINGAGLCVYDDNQCTEDYCQGGECKAEPYDDGHTCDDDLWCNGNETCQGGECKAGQPNCQDPNPCKFKECYEPSGGALEGTCGPSQGLEDGASCDDGLYCNGPDECDGDLNICISGPWPCVDLEYGICEEPDCNEDDLCFVKAVTDYNTCPDTVVCDGSEVCIEGECVDKTDPYDQYAACDRDNPCESYTCEEGTSPDCSYQNKSNGDDCDPDDPCFGSGAHYCIVGAGGTSQCTHGDTPYCASDKDGDLCTRHLSCTQEDDETVVCGVVANVNPTSLHCGDSLSFSTLTTNNEIETYSLETDAGPETQLEDMSGGEKYYKITFAGDPANYTLILSQDGTVFGDLYMIIVTDDCENVPTSYSAGTDSGNLPVRAPEGGMTHYLIIDGQDGNRGYGYISMECE